MEIKRKIEITLETNKRCIVRLPDDWDEGIFCPQCETVELLISAEQAAAFFNISRRTVYRLADNGSLHFVETDAGAVFVCPSSMQNVLPNDGTL